MAIRLKTTVKLRATAECPSHSRADIAIRDLSFAIDEPGARGGTNAGPTPTDTAIAALVGCVNVIGHKCAKNPGVEIEHLSIDAECEFDRRGHSGGGDQHSVRSAVMVTVRAKGSADQEVLDRVGIETEKFCPLSKLFRQAGTKLKVNWQNA